MALVTSNHCCPFAPPAGTVCVLTSPVRGSLFVVDSDELPPIDEPDTYYDHQLQGLRVRSTAGQDIGVVAEVLHTAGGELLAVKRFDDEAELLVPFVSAIVTSVSLEARIVEIDPPEGLLDLG